MTKNKTIKDFPYKTKKDLQDLLNYAYREISEWEKFIILCEKKIKLLK